MSQDQSTSSNPACSEVSIFRPDKFWARISGWNAKHPVQTIVLVSFLAVIVNCYPVIFCGKSFVSPTSTRDQLVYNWWPSLPGMQKLAAGSPNPFHNTHGSDIGTIMWWDVPAGFIESRSLLDHGELPLWNRYSHAGDPFIGQAVSMLGDPLQSVVIIGCGSAVAWDIKFLAAKFIFCVGFGWLILRLLRNRTISLVFTVLAAYCGAYYYINTHPSFFVFAYAPWILLAAIGWLDLQSKKNFRWGLVWLLANLSCFNAGHVELAVVLIGGLNLAAVALALTDCRDVASSAKVLCRIGIATLFFFGLAAPVWIPFLAALDGSYSVHMQVEVRQLNPVILPGAFDDLFYLLSRPNDRIALAPGTSLLTLAGCCFSIWRWRQLKAEIFFWINSTAIVLWGGCIFGWAPSSLLAAIPLLNRVGHIYTDFSYLLVIHLMIQSAYGFTCLAKAENLRKSVDGFVFVVGIFIAAFFFYSRGCWHQTIPWNYFLCAAAGAVGAPLLFVYLKSRRQQTLAIGWAGIIILGFIPNIRFGLYSFGDDTLLMLPGPRVVLNPPSPAVEKIKADKSGPFRVVGLQQCFIGDYSAVYELEDIRSCAPLSNGEFISLVRNFPGMELSEDWKIKVVKLAQAQPLLNLLNVKYLLTLPDVTTRVNLDFKITDRSDFGVVENEKVWPRAFFANKITTIDSNEQFIRQLSENGRQPFIAMTGAEIEMQPGVRQLEATNSEIISPATNYLLSVNSTEFDVRAPAAGVVCLTEGQAKDFTATANGESKEVLTVNRAFKGIYLDKPGNYHVKFTYRPRHWRLACALFWISTGIILALTAAEFFLTRVRKIEMPERQTTA